MERPSGEPALETSLGKASEVRGEGASEVGGGGRLKVEKGDLHLSPGPGVQV